MKSLSIKSKFFIATLLLTTFISSIFSNALAAGTIQLTTKSGNFAGFLSDEIKIPFDIITEGNFEKISLEVTPTSKDIIPENIENLYITTSGSSIKANPSILTNANGTYSGTIYIKASKDLIANNKAGITSVTLTAKTDKNQVAKLKLNVSFKKKTLTYGNNLSTSPVSTGTNLVPKAAFVGYVYSTEGFTQGLAATDFATDNKRISAVSNDASSSSVGGSPTPSPTATPKITPTFTGLSSSASSSEATTNTGTNSGAQKTSTVDAMLTVLLATAITILLYFLNILKSTTIDSKNAA